MPGRDTAPTIFFHIGSQPPYTSTSIVSHGSALLPIPHRKRTHLHVVLQHAAHHPRDALRRNQDQPRPLRAEGVPVRVACI